MPLNRSRLMPMEARLLAILEADGGWLDTQTVAYRQRQRMALSASQVEALRRLVAWGWVETEARIGPRGVLRKHYRFISHP